MVCLPNSISINTIFAIYKKNFSNARNSRENINKEVIETFKYLRYKLIADYLFFFHCFYIKCFIRLLY